MSHADSDVKGPSLSLGGHRKYYVTFTDDHARYTRLEILRTQDCGLSPNSARCACQMPEGPHSILAVVELLNNRWLFERVRAMLHQADLLKTRWALAEVTHFAVVKKAHARPRKGSSPKRHPIIREKIRRKARLG